jgi:glycosyltransferase involved in cell wall biosynthesis
VPRRSPRPRVKPGTVITFLVATSDHPTGGAIALYEFANGMRRRGYDVHVVHIELGSNRLGAVDDIEWCSFEEGIHHWFPDSSESFALPDASFLACAFPGEHPPQAGLPFVFLQGYGIWPQEFENRTFRAPTPKICIANWLVEVAKRLGVPEHEVVHIPYGIKHEKYRVMSPIEDRPLQVAMLYRDHISKGPAHGLEALAEVKRRLPETDVVLFSPMPPRSEIPSWIRFHTNPPQRVIVDEVYNQSRVFLCPSVVEGFGLMCVEAMACGAALVTTDNGGSKDYAVHGETALVCEPGDVMGMADHIETLLRDDANRVRLSTRGTEFVERFDWDVSAGLLESFVRDYGSNPEQYGLG